MPLPPAERAFVSRLKLRQLLLVAALDERRSLRKAAADLAMTQPAATKLLRVLSRRSGCRCSPATRGACCRPPTERRSCASTAGKN